MRHKPRYRPAQHLAEATAPRPSHPTGPQNFSPNALRRLLATTQITRPHSYLANGRTLEDYRSSIWMYMDRYVESGDMTTLAKAILKSVSLRGWMLEHEGHDE